MISDDEAFKAWLEDAKRIRNAVYEATDDSGSRLILLDKAISPYYHFRQSYLAKNHHPSGGRERGGGGNQGTPSTARDGLGATPGVADATANPAHPSPLASSPQGASQPPPAEDRITPNPEAPAGDFIIIVSGKTFMVKDKLRALGYRYSKETKDWAKNVSDMESARRELEAAIGKPNDVKIEILEARR